MLNITETAAAGDSTCTLRSNVRDGFCVSLSLNLNLNLKLSLLFVLDTSGGACSHTCCGRGDCCFVAIAETGAIAAMGAKAVAERVL
jgi:hypothetical protein